MSNATEAYPLSDAERKGRETLLKRLGVNFAPAIAETIPLDREVRKRRPLGLTPGDGSSESIPSDDPAPAFASSVPSVAATWSAETLARPATMADIAECLDTAIGIGLESDALVGGRLRELRGQVAELKLAHGKLVNENTALRLILENLRVTQRGERGVDGDRGPPGRDGRDGVGQIGPRGERGPRGEPAARIVSWEIADSDFVAYPLLSTGDRGPGLHLRGMFEVYNEQVNAADDAAEIEAAAAKREAAKREVADR
jgi:hypothetical protein